MKSFNEFIIERSGKGLTIFDIDETMFVTKAKVKVVKDGKVIKLLDNKQFNKYVLKKNEEFDFGEFTSAEIFNKTSTPIARMINKVKAVLRHATKAGSKVIIVTARPNFDNKDLFLDTFRNQGIDIDNIYVERAGNLGSGPAADNKIVIFKKYLDSNQFKRIRLFDDAIANIKALLSLKNEYKDVEFEGYLADHNGSVRRIR
jgi:hypothetical protein|tara:strand:+ start:545 stop:1150 length:606 start_codon:yes stop_codon:yes gene_type:complete